MATFRLKSNCWTLRPCEARSNFVETNYPAAEFFNHREHREHGCFENTEIKTSVFSVV